MLEELNREELKELLDSYNDYVMHFRETHDISCEPISVYEYYENDYQMIEEEDDDNMYCANCGNEKEDYESMLCDKCFEEEQERLYNDYDDEEEVVETLKSVAVRDLKDNNGLKVILIGSEDDIINTFEFDINIKHLNDIELYKLCKNISFRVNNMYYEYKGHIGREQVLEIVREELVK